MWAVADTATSKHATWIWQLVMRAEIIGERAGRCMAESRVDGDLDFKARVTTLCFEIRWVRARSRVVWMLVGNLGMGSLHPEINFESY